MLEPMVSDLIRVEKVGRSEFRVIAKRSIPSSTIIEVCPTLALQSRLAITLGQSAPSFDNKFVIDTELIDKEYQVISELADLELERRLNEGLITGDDYRQIIASKVDFNSILNLKSHLIPLGYGLLYKISDFPNMVREYHADSKLCLFRAVQYIEAGSELTYSV